MDTPISRHTWTATSSGVISTAGVTVKGFGRSMGVYVQTSTAAGSTATVEILTAMTSTSPTAVLGTITVDSPGSADYASFSGPIESVFPRVVGVTGTVTIRLVVT